ncbi:MAG: hypothetical protein JSS66_09110 [Armatimonadetes bacterium]|nr:hypothetical protein [Armatimonadota bacterium]
MRSRKSGSVTVYVLLVFSLLVMVSASSITYSFASLARTTSDARNSSANNLAQAALEYGISKAFADVQSTKGSFLARQDNMLDTLKDYGTGVTAASCRVVPTGDASTAWVTSSATVDGRSMSVRTYLKAKDVGIWNNAIFAGAGASGQAINGNVDIRGSVHLLGDGEPFIDQNGNGKWDGAEPYTDTNKNGKWDPGEPYTDVDGNGSYSPAEVYQDANGNGIYDPPLTVTDLNSAFSGNSGVQNHYQGINVALQSVVPPCPVVNGMQTLGAEVRVKNGMIGLSGSASLGTGALVNGAAYKTTIDASFCTGGYTGTKGSSAVFSDNGVTNGYDLGSLGISYPFISGIGAKPYVDKDNQTWPTQEAYLDAKSLTIPVALVKSSTTAFSYGPDANGNSISFTPAGNKGNPPAKLTINGIIKVPDGFQLGVKDSLTYAGAGTFYCPGTMLVDGDVLPSAGLIFPTTTKIGFIAKKDLKLATGNGSAQLNLTGAFYAQGRVVSAKQNQIMGTMVGSYYDLGTNVPSIYQVPTLSKNLPPAMPGDKAYITLDLKSWRTRKAG